MKSKVRLTQPPVMKPAGQLAETMAESEVPALVHPALAWAHLSVEWETWGHTQETGHLLPCV